MLSNVMNFIFRFEGLSRELDFLLLFILWNEKTVLIQAGESCTKTESIRLGDCSRDETQVFTVKNKHPFFVPKQ